MFSFSGVVAAAVLATGLATGLAPGLTSGLAPGLTSGTGEIAAPSASGPLVSGRLVNPAGDPVPGLSVTVQPLDVVQTAGRSAAPTVLGTATTDARGRWSVRLPAVLPDEVEAAVRRNGGVLNLTASANGVAGGASFVAMRALSVAVGSASPDTAASRRRVVPARLRAYSSAPATLVLAPTTTPTAPGGTRAAAHAVPVDDWCFPWIFETTKSHIYWTSVASEHAYWNATGSVAYSKTASSGVGMELSVGGGGFQFSGYSQQTNTISATLSVGALGPKVSRLFQIPVRYLWQKGQQRCHSGTQHGVRIVAGGWRVDPKTKHAYRWGRSVLSKDGHAAFTRSNPKFRTANKAHDSWTITSGKSLTIGAAASAFGVGIRAYTTWGNGHAQVWKAGGRSTRAHWTWCARSSILGRNPGVLYNW